MPKRQHQPKSPLDQFPVDNRTTKTNNHDSLNDEDDTNTTTTTTTRERGTNEDDKTGEHKISQELRKIKKFFSKKVDGVGISCSRLFLLFLAFDFAVEIARYFLRESGEDLQLLLFFYERLSRQISEFVGVNLFAIKNGDDDSNYGGDRMGLVCDSSALTAIVIFSTCILIGLNDVTWTPNSPRRSLSATVTYIACVAFYAHLIMYYKEDVLAVGTDGTIVSILRHVEWMFTTPILIMLAYQLQAVSFPENAQLRSKMYAAIVYDEGMLVTGIACHFLSGIWWWMSLLLSFAFFFHVMLGMGKIFYELTTKLEHEDDRLRFLMLGLVQSVCWSSFPAVFLAKEFDFISSQNEHEWYLVADVCTKSAYSYLLCQGNIRVIDGKAKDEMEELQLLTEFQREFFFNITHELRMPLNSVIGFNTLAVENGSMDNFSGELIKNSLTSAEALLGLINQVLDYAKFNRKGKTNKSAQHGLDLSEDAFTLEHLISQTMDISQQGSTSFKRGVDVFFEIKPPELFCETIVGDYYRIRQCLVNIVDNAIKYSANEDELNRRGMVNIAVEGRMEQSELFIEFRVKDNGVGIPVKKQSTVFVPFSQPTNDSEMRKQGTGLGLSITRAIIECMGGTVTFNSNEGFGTTFTIAVPFKRTKQGDNGTYSSSTSGEEVLTQLPKDLLYIVCENHGPRRNFLLNLLACYGIENYNVLTLDVSPIYAPQDRINKAMQELHRFENSPTIKPVLFTYMETLVENIADFIDINLSMCIFGSPTQLININKGRFEFIANSADGRDTSVSEKDLEEFLNSAERRETCMTPVRPGEFFKIVRRLTGISQEEDSSKVNFNTSILSAEDAPGIYKRNSFDLDSTQMKKISSGNMLGIDSDSENDTGRERSEVPEGLKVVPQKKKVPPKDSLKHEADWDLDISSMRVLLVEDNLMNQKVATVSMSACNVTTHIADNGKIAVDAYRRVIEGKTPPYDVILMDQMMPVMSGTEATVSIRELELEARKRFESGESKKEPPPIALIVGLSANVGPEHVAAIQIAGMDGTLSKPFYPSTLRGLLRDVYLGRYMGFRDSDAGYVRNAQSKPGN
jgi:signal transduction histidine kinase/CheY-like chemotaxis protein